MKLLLATCLKEQLEAVLKIFKETHIDMFSTTEMTGHKDVGQGDLLDDWFVSGGEQVDSIMLFAFTGEEKAGLAKGLIESHNESNDPNFLIKAFTMPVDESF